MSYRYEIHRGHYADRYNPLYKTKASASKRRFETWMEACNAGDRYSDKRIDEWTEVFGSNDPVNARREPGQTVDL